MAQLSDRELDAEARRLAREESPANYKEDGDPTPAMLAASEADRGVREDTEQPDIDWN